MRWSWCSSHCPWTSPRSSSSNSTAWTFHYCRCLTYRRIACKAPTLFVCFETLPARSWQSPLTVKASWGIGLSCVINGTDRMNNNIGLSLKVSFAIRSHHFCEFAHFAVIAKDIQDGRTISYVSRLGPRWFWIVDHGFSVMTFLRFWVVIWADWSWDTNVIGFWFNVFPLRTATSTHFFHQSRSSRWWHSR